MQGIQGYYSRERDSIIMIKAPLTFHSPEDIYHFLRNNVGPLYMAIKHSQAIIHFVRPEDAAKALEKYRNGKVNHYPLQLAPYKEGDIQEPPSSQMALPKKPEQQEEVVVPGPAQSEFSQLIRSHLQAMDPNDYFQSTLKENKEELIKYLLSLSTPLDAANKKRKEIEAIADPQLKGQKMKEFTHFYKKALNDIKETTQDTFRSFRKRCAKFGEQQNVDLDPTIEISRPSKVKSDSQGYKVNVEHINRDFQGLKRIGVLNDQHFVCSAFNYHKGHLLYFKGDDEHLQMSTEVKEGAYGLVVLDNHVLVGTNQGSIAFYTAPELTQREISLPLHNGLIYEVIKHSDRVGGYNLLTLGCDNLLKLWNSSIDNITEDQSTLFFQQSLRISHNLLQISSVDVLGPGNRIAYSCEKSLLLHDCVKEQATSTVICKKKILKISALDENNIGTANQTFVTFVDTRNNANTLDFKFDKIIRTLTSLGPYSVFYGCEDGEVGLADRRNTKCVWRNTIAHGSSKGKIYDVARMGEMVLSADNKGQVVSWAPTRMESEVGKQMKE